MEEMMNHSWNAHARLLRRCALYLALLMMLLVAAAQAQPATMDQAFSVYDSGEYEQAASLFKTIGRDEMQAFDVRRDALIYLGLASIAMSEMEQARSAISDLLALQPPLIELEPDDVPPALLNVYYEERGTLEVPTASPGIRTLAVMDFRNYAFEDHDQWDPMQWGFSSMMIEQLSGATDLKLVERENLQYVLQELDLQSAPGRVDQDTAVRMGKQMGAHAMAFGGIYIMGKDMRLSARVVKVETGEILLGESVEGRSKDFYELLEKLSLQVARALNSNLTETEVGDRTETRSIDALHAFALGLDLEQKGAYQEAVEKYLEAVEYDPSYVRASARAKSLKPMLAVANAKKNGSSGGSRP